MTYSPEFIHISRALLAGFVTTCAASLPMAAYALVVELRHRAALREYLIRAEHPESTAIAAQAIRRSVEASLRGTRWSVRLERLAVLLMFPGVLLGAAGRKGETFVPRAFIGCVVVYSGCWYFPIILGWW